jgi:glycerol-3-phosphate cytidylyltransferase
MKKKIGYTTGIFDVFHIGHLNLIKQAKLHCDKLIVGVSTSKVVREKNKIAVNSYKTRKDIINSLIYVDKTIAQNSIDKIKEYKKVKFDILFVGDDWKNTPTWNKFEKELKKYNVKIKYFKYTQHISSTKLRKFINNYHF